MHQFLEEHASTIEFAEVSKFICLACAGEHQAYIDCCKAFNISANNRMKIRAYMVWKFCDNMNRDILYTNQNKYIIACKQTKDLVSKLLKQCSCIMQQQA